MDAFRFAVEDVFQVGFRNRGGGGGAAFIVPDEEGRMLSIDLVENVDIVRGES